MIIETNAIVDPGAVMVKALDTPVANATVTRAVCANDLTIGAEKHWIENLHHFHKTNPSRTLNVTRVFEHG